MAVVWRRTIEGRTFEVRSAGRTRRLLVDRVLHTAWNPAAPLTGAVWDPLALAALLAEAPGRTRTVLLLGLGGGAAVHLLRRHAAPVRVVAVEIDGTLIGVAREHFGIDGPDLRVVHGDAIAWAAAAAPRTFDVVIDDLFGERGGEPVRAAAGRAWWGTLAARTSPGGVLVVNFAERRALSRSGLLDDPRLRRRFPSALLFRCPGYTNAIVALSRCPDAARALRARLAELPSLPRSGRLRPRFRTTTLR